jgi:hypothetical protein
MQCCLVTEASPQMQWSTTVSQLAIHVCSALSPRKAVGDRMLAEGHMISLDDYLGAIYSGVLLVVALWPERGWRSSLAGTAPRLPDQNMSVSTLTV